MLFFLPNARHPRHVKVTTVIPVFKVTSGEYRHVNKHFVSLILAFKGKQRGFREMETGRWRRRYCHRNKGRSGKTGYWEITSVATNRCMLVLKMGICQKIARNILSRPCVLCCVFCDIIYYYSVNSV